MLIKQCLTIKGSGAGSINSGRKPSDIRTDGASIKLHPEKLNLQSKQH